MSNWSMMDSCFLCMADQCFPTKLSTARVKAEVKSELASSKTNSLEALSRYLKLGRKKVFLVGRTISEELLGKSERSQLKVELCDECSILNVRFVELYEKLEKVQMEVMGALEHIYGKLAKGEKIRTTGGSNKLDDDDKQIRGEDLKEFEVCKTLRMEALKKCAQKLHSTSPRVKIEQIKEQGLKLQDVVEDYDIAADDNDNYSDSSYDPQTDMKMQHEDLKQYGKRKTMASSIVKKVPVPVKIKLDDRVKWKCSGCEKMFSSYGGYRRHYKSSHLGLRMKCQFCSKSFSDICHVRRHQRLKNCNRKVTRSSSPVNDNVGKILDSNLTNLKQDKFSEQKADVKFNPTETNISNDQSTDADPNIDVGPVKVEKPNTDSSILFENERKIIEGRVKVQSSGLTKWKCLECNKILRNAGTHRRHYKAVHLGDNLKCDLCNKSFSSRWHVLRHQSKVDCTTLITTKQKWIVDNRTGCAGSLPGKSSSVRDKAEDKMKCHICHHHVNNLSTHQFNVHFGRRTETKGVKDANYSLQIIKPSTIQTGHCRVDPKTGKTICQLCSKEFVTGSGYRLHHKTVHLKERYKCKICGIEFPHRKTFRAHYRNVHMGVRFECHRCDKVFTLKANLSVHLQMTRCGMGGKKVKSSRSKCNTPGGCHICGEDFKVSRDLYEHLKIVHVERARSNKNQSTPRKATEVSKTDTMGLPSVNCSATGENAGTGGVASAAKVKDEKGNIEWPPRYQNTCKDDETAEEM